MRPCYFYAKNREIEGFKCEYESIEYAMYLTCQNPSKDLCERNVSCPKFAECVKLADETYRRDRVVNVTINDFGDGRIEVVYHKKPYKVPEVIINDKSDKSRNFKLVNFDLLFPVKPLVGPAKLERSLLKSTKRAHDRFRGYSTANKWHYFFTFTFSPKLIPNRNNDFVLESLWQRLQDKLKKFDSGVKILNVPERHKNGVIHYHALMTFSEQLPIVDYGDISRLPQRTCEGGPNKGKTGFCTYNKDGTFTILPKTNYKYFLVPYYDYGEIQRSTLGDMLFCLNRYEYGRNSCALLPLDDTNQERAGNYLSTYTTKGSNLGYNRKRFMRTRNLANKTKTTIYVEDDAINDFIDSFGNVEKFKEKDGLIVYRNFNVDKTPGATSVLERLKR